jgi:hypothetical protein
MVLSHRPHAVSAGFGDPNLVAAAGLVPVAALAVAAGLRNLADERLSDDDCCCDPPPGLTDQFSLTYSSQPTLMDLSAAWALYRPTSLPQKRSGSNHDPCSP